VLQLEECICEHIWEQTNKSLSTQLKRKNSKALLSACLGLPIGCMKVLFSEEFVTIFGLGYAFFQTILTLQAHGSCSAF
jgi:hypothetical protein